MPRPEVALCWPSQTTVRSRRPNGPGVRKDTVSREAYDIDAFAASPWIGLHYKHEFLLHHRHEHLENRSNDMHLQFLDHGLKHSYFNIIYEFYDRLALPFAMLFLKKSKLPHSSKKA